MVSGGDDWIEELMIRNLFPGLAPEGMTEVQWRATVAAIPMAQKRRFGWRVVDGDDEAAEMARFERYVAGIPGDAGSD